MSIVSLILSCLSLIIIVVLGVCLYNVYKDYKHNKKVIDEFKTDVSSKLINKANIIIEKDVALNKSFLLDLERKYYNLKDSHDNLNKSFNDEQLSNAEHRNNLLSEINNIKEKLNNLDIVDKIVNEKLSDMCVDIKNNKELIDNNHNKVDGSIDIDSGTLTKLKEYFDNKIDSVVDELEKQIDNVDDFYYIRVDE